MKKTNSLTSLVMLALGILSSAYAIDRNLSTQERFIREAWNGNVDAVRTLISDQVIDGETLYKAKEWNAAILLNSRIKHLGENKREEYLSARREIIELIQDRLDKNPGLMAQYQRAREGEEEDPTGVLVW